MNPYLASDTANPDFVGARNPDDLAIVRFFNHEVENGYQSNIQGRPIFDTVVFVEIKFPGDTLCINCRPANADDRNRWPRHWAHFEKGNSDEIIPGTPLGNWPVLKPNQIAELKALGFHTVDQVASSSDAQIGRIGMIAGMNAYGFRDAAIRFLAVAKDAGMLEKQIEQNKKLEEMQKAMSARMEEQQRRLDEALAMLENATAPQHRGPGRPRKEEAA